MAKAHQIINRYDDDLTKESDIAKRMQIKREANREIGEDGEEGNFGYTV